MIFPVCALFLLSIERILYGYMFQFPNHFKAACKNGTFGSKIQKEPLYWKAAMQLGMFIKVFQYSVILYDVFVRCSINISLSSPRCWLGLVMLGVGQILNFAVFRALGGIGVYYGYELGYKTEFTTSFPYNMGIPDPQYWGVVVCIWGIYLLVGADSMVTPVLETFWYVMSMQIIEHSNGALILQALGVTKNKYIKG